MNLKRRASAQASFRECQGRLETLKLIRIRIRIRIIMAFEQTLSSCQGFPGFCEARFRTCVCRGLLPG